MGGSQLEYLGFTARATVREYTLALRHLAGGFHLFTLAIANQAFLDHRVRYQDGPSICFSKLQTELAAHADGLPGDHFDLTDADFEAYRSAHAPRSSQRQPRVPRP